MSEKQNFFLQMLKTVFILSSLPWCAGSIRVSSPLMVTGLVLTLTAVVMSIVGSVRHSGKTVIAAILYVLTGILSYFYFFTSISLFFLKMLESFKMIFFGFLHLHPKEIP